MTCLIIISQLKDFILVKVDVNGAYIQTEMSSSLVSVKLDKKLMGAVINIL